MNVLKEIASENGVTLQLEGDSSATLEVCRSLFEMFVFLFLKIMATSFWYFLKIVVIVFKI